MTCSLIFMFTRTQASCYCCVVISYNTNVYYVVHMISGPVVMDMSGYSEKGFKRKLAVQALFGKVFYLSEVSHYKYSMKSNFHEYFLSFFYYYSFVLDFLYDFGLKQHYIVWME